MTDAEETDEEKEAKYYHRLYHGNFWSRMFNWDFSSAIYGVVAVIAIFGFFAFFWGAFMPSDTEAKRNARRLLEAHGYVDIRLSEVALFSCGRNDVNSESVAFKAVSATGMPLEGEVCCGWLKDCVIRFKYQDYDD